MRLTTKQLEVMDAYWESPVPLTIPDVVKASSSRTWSEKSIHTMIAQLEAKGVLALSSDPDKYVKAYKPAMTFDEYMVENLLSVNNERKESVRLSVAKLNEVVINIRNKLGNE